MLYIGPLLSATIIIVMASGRRKKAVTVVTVLVLALSLPTMAAYQTVPSGIANYPESFAAGGFLQRYSENQLLYGGYGIASLNYSLQQRVVYITSTTPESASGEIALSLSIENVYRHSTGLLTSSPQMYVVLAHEYGINTSNIVEAAVQSLVQSGDLIYSNSLTYMLAS